MSSTFRWVILAVISCALLLVVIDMTVLYTALPRLTHDLQATATQKLWIVNAYPLTVAALLVSMGVLNDRYGARRCFHLGLMVFGVASLAAAFSASAAMLIVARALLAVGAAAMMPATMVIVRKSFDDPGERALAIGIWAAVASGGAALGPVVGGLLLEYFWWGSVFLINVPVVLLVLLLSVKLIPAMAGNPQRVFSLTAASQILVGLIGLIYVMKEFSKTAPSLSIALVSGAAGAVMTLLFIRGQLREKNPMLDLSLFHNRFFTAGAIAALVSPACMIGIELAVTQRFQLIQQMSPFIAGLFILPLPIASFFSGPMVGWLVPRIGSVNAMLISLMGSAAGLGMYLLVDDSALWMTVVALAITGAGLGGAMTAASTAIILNSPEHNSGAAAAVEGVSFEFGGTLGITLFGGTLSAVYSMDMSAVPGLPALAQDSIDGAFIAAASMTSGEAGRLLLLAEAAFMRGFVAAIAASIVALLLTCAVLVRYTRRHRSQAST